jgi:hypothetical protein
VTSIASEGLHAGPRRQWWGARLRARWAENRALNIAERERLPWSEPEAVEPDPEPEMRMRSSVPPEGGGWPTLPPVEPPHPPQPHPEPVQPPQPTVHPPFAHRPAQHTHVAIRMQRVLTEAAWDPDLTPRKLLNAMGPLIVELTKLAAAQDDQERRMGRNQATAQAQRVLLEDAVLRGVPDEVAVEQATSGIIGRAVHVASEERTGTMPKITEDLPDPRTAGLPRDENPGDVEPPPEESPVHAEDDVPMPLPTEEFVGGEKAQGSDAMVVDVAPDTDAPAPPKPKPRMSPRKKAAVAQEAEAAP